MTKLTSFQIKPLFDHPLFQLGLAIKFLCISLVFPDYFLNWYGPFLSSSIANFSLDPWSTFLNEGGNALAFPYGYIMWLSFLPGTLISKALDAPLYFGYGFTLLTADALVLLMLTKLTKASNRFLLVFYWLSPIVLFSTYWLGLNDIIPVSLLCISLYFLMINKPLASGLAVTAAISAKLSMILAVPFMLIYLFLNKPRRKLLPPFLAGSAASFACLLLPFLFSNSAMEMLFNNPEMGKIYHFSLVDNLGNSFLYFLPFAYAITLYLFWSMKRHSFELLVSVMGISFLLVLLMTPAAPGWFVWVLPMLIAYQSNSKRMGISLVASFATLYILETCLTTTHPKLLGFDIINPVIQQALLFLPEKTTGLTHTALLAIGVILLAEVWRQMVGQNEYYRQSRSPIVLGIAGDSGSGKDTLADAVEGLFGQHSVTQISGDDYHYWDRKKPMWQAMTHLNPRANDLSQYTNDLVKLVDGQYIHARHYDHSSGIKTKPRKIKSNDVIIASGLHALYSPVLRNCYDLSVYLDIDEDLRTYFKIKRDVTKRGHSLEKVLASIQKRKNDSEAFVLPQKKHADLVFCLQPVNPNHLTQPNDSANLRLKLGVFSKPGIFEEQLLRILIGLCGLHVDVMLSNDESKVVMIIEGDVSNEDIEVAANQLLPNINTVLDMYPKWEDGMLGIMQLFIMSQVHLALNKRIL